MREYIAYGQDWEWAIRVLHSVDNPQALEDVDEVLVHRIGADHNVRDRFDAAAREAWEWYLLREEENRAECDLMLPICEPWKSFCRKHETLASLFANVGLPYDQPPPPPKKVAVEDLTDVSTAGLLASVNKANFYASRCVLDETVTMDDETLLLESVSSEDERRAMLALRGLGRLGTPEAFEAVKSYIEACGSTGSRTRRYAFYAIAEMPGSLTLDLARQWFHRKEHHFHYPAGLILANHATHEDLDLLIEALRQPETLRREDFRLSNVLEALARFSGIGPIPELEQVFGENGHCYDRHRAAAAMAVTAPVHFAADYAFECLWDCHRHTRELGCDTVSLSTPGALDRLRELASDTADDDDVREAAEKRLAGF
ncbi:MAG: hypothetical protein JW993_18740 [Sedimentisphaerales bacterium]|nr:hypothetical protein [Sedimentisphaerales bacterium]